MKPSPVSFSSLLQTFFIDYLPIQRQLSPHSIASYRDTFRLLLGYAKAHKRYRGKALELDDITSDLICDFLKYLEKERRITARTRNQRLAAIKSFYKYALLKAPDFNNSITQILAIPIKRFDRGGVDFLNSEESDALLRQPNQSTWIGRRNYVLILTAICTGMRLSELTNLKRADVVMKPRTFIRCIGKGRKQRDTPMTKQLKTTLDNWMKELPSDVDFLFPTASGDRLSNDSVQHLLKKYAKSAEEVCPALHGKRVSPHVLRHTTAMELLSSGVPIPIISMWIGHEDPGTTSIYFSENVERKEKILTKIQPKGVSFKRFKPQQDLLDFLTMI